MRDMWEAGALEQVMAKRWLNGAMVALTAAALALACTDSQEPGAGKTPRPSPFVVSGPVPAPPSAAVGVARSESSASPVVYVSLPPAAIPDGRTVTIRDSRVGSIASTVMVDGGFDPIAVTADVGDTLAISVLVGGAGAPVSYTVAVPEGAPPIVVRTSPPPHKRDVPLNASMVVVFSQPLDPATVDTASVKLWRGPTAVDGTVRFADAAYLRAEFHPDTLLAGNTDYQLIVSQSIHGVNGLPLDSAVAVPFTTGSTQPPTNLVFASVSVGFTHACGVTTAGAAYCWGENYNNGTLGDGTLWSTALSPVAVAGGLTFAAVSAGYFHTCGVTTSGAAYCWGQYRLLGEGSLDSLGQARLVPVPVAGGLTFASVSSGLWHSCGVTTAGAAYCWGSNQYGELGDGTTNFGGTPVPVAGGLTFAEVSAGGYHSCGVTTAGVAYCWGQNTMGELGDGTTTDTSVPVAVAGGLSFRTVRTEWAHSCGVTTTGAAYCWGDNQYDLLGSGTRPPTGPEQCNDATGLFEWGPSVLPCSSVPAKVAGGLILASLTTGGQDSFACGLTSAGDAFCWGMGDWGAIAPTTAPLPVPGGLTFATLSAGYQSICGVTPGGVAYCWGTGDRGELGDGTTSSSSVPVKVAGQP
jgi:alpha-tubulin suppressor-like RCC1 family protein